MRILSTKPLKVSVATAILAVSQVGTAFAQATKPITISDTGVGVNSISRFLSSGVKIAILIAAILTFVYLIWGGIQWITSGGDKSANEAARNRITAALIGLAIVAAAWALMSVVGYFLGVNPFALDIPTAGRDGNPGQSLTF